MNYPARNRHCPARKTCFDYHNRACGDCDWGREFHKLHCKIARLKKKVKDLEEKEHGKTADKIG